MRILILNDLLPPDYEGGLELSALQIGLALRARGHEVEWVTSAFRPEYTGERKDVPGVHRVLQFVETRARNRGRKEECRALHARIRAADKNLPLLQKFFSEHGPYDVHYVFGLSFVGLGTATALPSPTAYSVADEFIPAQRNADQVSRAFQWVTRLSGTARQRELQVRPEAVAFISRYIRDVYAREGLLPELERVIPRAIAFEPLDQAEWGDPLVFAACRIDEAKGLDVAVEALAHLHRCRPEVAWQFEFAGKPHGDALGRLQAQIERHQLGNRCRYLGMLTPPEVIQKMRQARVFVNPARWEEPFGRTNLEALACGAALLASDGGAIREIVADEPCALIHTKEDAQTLSQHLETVLTQRDAWQALVDAGLRRVQRYRMDRIAEETEAFLVEVVERGQKVN